MKGSSNKLFQIIISLTLLFCMADICIAQYDSLLIPQQISLKKEKRFNEIKPDDDWNLRNFPFQFGLELGTSIIREDDPVNIGFISSMDVNLYDRAMFLRFELGAMSIEEGGGVKRYNEEEPIAEWYASLVPYF